MASIAPPYTGYPTELIGDYTDEEDAEMTSQLSNDDDDDERQAAAPAKNNPDRPKFSAPPSLRRNPPHSIPSTPFAPPYRSTHIAEKSHAHLFPLLGHVNCSYLSTPGVAPSLIQLKQHAQSLAILIKSLTISTKPAAISSSTLSPSAKPNAYPSSPPGESWDWLTDLTKPYDGPENPALYHHHSLPLTSTLNVLEQVPASAAYEGGTQVSVRDRCALYRAEHHLRTSPNGSSLPYATHQSLISHANQLLELLDHEYSAKGGLLSILPPKSEREDREKAEATLLGQYILYTQRLVARLHELEREYANALDVLKGEAKVPLQTLSRLGPDGRKGRELAYPQDRFVLVNAGEDVWTYLDKAFGDRERVDEVLRRDYLKQGVMGEKLWEQRGGREFSRGITAINVTTRYYRLRNDPLKTVFVIPAWQTHPGVKATVELESKPTVVSVVRPVWPERQSLWEQKNRRNLADLERLKRENEALKMQEGWDRDDKTLLTLEGEKSAQRVRELERKVKKLEIIINDDRDEGAEERREVYRRLEELEEKETAANKMVEDAEKLAKEAQEDATKSQKKIEELEREAEYRRSLVVERETALEQPQKGTLAELEGLGRDVVDGLRESVPFGHDDVPKVMEGLKRGVLSIESTNASAVRSPAENVVGSVDGGRRLRPFGNFKGEGRTLGDVTMEDAASDSDYQG